MRPIDAFIERSATAVTSELEEGLNPLGSVSVVKPSKKFRLLPANPVPPMHTIVKTPERSYICRIGNAPKPTQAVFYGGQQYTFPSGVELLLGYTSENYAKSFPTPVDKLIRKELARLRRFTSAQKAYIQKKEAQRVEAERRFESRKARRLQSIGSQLREVQRVLLSLRATGQKRPDNLRAAVDRLQSAADRVRHATFISKPLKLREYRWRYYDFTTQRCVEQAVLPQSERKAPILLPVDHLVGGAEQEVIEFEQKVSDISTNKFTGEIEYSDSWTARTVVPVVHTASGELLGSGVVFREGPVAVSHDGTHFLYTEAELQAAIRKLQPKSERFVNIPRFLIETLKDGVGLTDALRASALALSNLRKLVKSLSKITPKDLRPLLQQIRNLPQRAASVRKLGARALTNHETVRFVYVPGFGRIELSKLSDPQAKATVRAALGRVTTEQFRKLDKKSQRQLCEAAMQTFIDTSPSWLQEQLDLFKQFWECAGSLSGAELAIRFGPCAFVDDALAILKELAGGVSRMTEPLAKFLERRGTTQSLTRTVRDRVSEYPLTLPTSATLWAGSKDSAWFEWDGSEAQKASILAGEGTPITDPQVLEKLDARLGAMRLGPNQLNPSLSTWTMVESARQVLTALCSYDVTDALGWSLSDSEVRQRWTMDRLGFFLNARTIWQVIPGSFIIDFVVGQRSFWENLEVPNIQPKVSIYSILLSSRNRKMLRWTGQYPVGWTKTYTWAGPVATREQQFTITDIKLRPLVLTRRYQRQRVPEPQKLPYPPEFYYKPPDWYKLKTSLEIGISHS